MSRTQFVILMLTMPIWLAMAIILWDKNPLFILIPCGIASIGFIAVFISFIFAAELKTVDDWDLVIRSILHRLGFKVQPPKSLMNDIELDNPEHWHHHDHDHHVEKEHEQ